MSETFVLFVHPQVRYWDEYNAVTSFGQVPFSCPPEDGVGFMAVFRDESEFRRLHSGVSPLRIVVERRTQDDA